MNLSFNCFNLKSLGQQAIINLNAAKLRSFLALLGILVGTAAVVALISSGRLATEKALATFKALGTDLMAVTVFQKDLKSLDPKTSHQGLSLASWQAIPEKIQSLRKIAPYAIAYQPINYQGKILSGSIIAADTSLAEILHISVAKGRFVSFVDSFEHFCVIGNDVARQIEAQSHKSPLLQQIQIGRIIYTIIGIARPWKENAFFNEDINNAIIIPIKGLALISPEATINNAIMRLKPNSPIDPVIEDLRQYIKQAAPAFSLFSRSPKQIIASMESQSDIFTWLLLVIASISLIVGGIGIMNVMLVSVSERKKEIGIRKAVGAKNSQIQALFLMESVILSLAGGAFGVLLGLLTTRILAYFCDWDFILHLTPALAGFTVSIITGIFFGFYPALRAAKMEAVVSLRSE
jgi:putative ABC transport system permease protein